MSIRYVEENLKFIKFRDLVDFNTSKLLKEKRFKEHSNMGYTSKGDLTTSISYYDAPEKWQVQRWLRKVHNIHIEIYYRQTGWFYRIVPLDSKFYNNRQMAIGYSKKNASSYEEALESGILKTLELIK